jgi:hypothetical protein
MKPARPLALSHCKCRDLKNLLQKIDVSVNDWYNFWDKIRGNYKVYPHITGIRRKSNSQDFKNFGVFPYYLPLPPGNTIFTNDVSHREELLSDYVDENKLKHQCSADLQKRDSYNLSQPELHL